MILNIKVIPKASRNLVKEENDGLKVYVTAPPDKNKANKAVLDLLANHYKVKKTNISIIRGQHAQRKTIEIKP